MRATGILFVSALWLSGCSIWNSPTSPSEPASVNNRAGVSVSIVDVSRPWVETQLLAVRVETDLTVPVEDPQVWTCLARTADTVIISSCRDSVGTSGRATTVVHTGIYYVNSDPVVTETRYVVSFVTSGDILRRRGLYPPLEMKESELTTKIAARTRVERVWLWDPIKLGANERGSPAGVVRNVTVTASPPTGRGSRRTSVRRRPGAAGRARQQPDSPAVS